MRYCTFSLVTLVFAGFPATPPYAQGVPAGQWYCAPLDRLQSEIATCPMRWIWITDPTPILRRHHEKATGVPTAPSQSLQASLDTARRDVANANDSAVRTCSDLGFEAIGLENLDNISIIPGRGISSQLAVSHANAAVNLCRTKAAEARDEQQTILMAQYKEAQRDGVRYVNQYSVIWKSTSLTDEMSDSKILRVSSTQSSDNEDIEVEVALTCKQSTKALDIRAVSYTKDGSGTKLIDRFRGFDGSDKTRAEARFGASAPPITVGLPIGDYSNEAILVVDPKGDTNAERGDLSVAIPDEKALLTLKVLEALGKQDAAKYGNIEKTTADYLLQYPRVLYKLKTAQGEIVIKVLPYDPAVFPVVLACAKASLPYINAATASTQPSPESAQR
jgi:hypothetical protein